MRRALIDESGSSAGDAASRAGLAELARLGPHVRRWWRFEGVTKADCMIETQRLLLMVEGKRTEALSRSIDWVPNRSQFIRNLEALDQAAGIKAAAMLVICEQDRPVTEPSDAELDIGLSHLPQDLRVRVVGRYIGQVTWLQACEATGIPYRTLPRSRADLARFQNERPKIL